MKMYSEIGRIEVSEYQKMIAVLESIRVAPKEKQINTSYNFTENFRYQDTSFLFLGDASKLDNNMEAILLVKRLEKEDRLPTKEEKEVLSKFIGWGGLAKYFNFSVLQSETGRYVRSLSQEERLNKQFSQHIQDFKRSYISADIDEVRKGMIKALLTQEEFTYAIENTASAFYTNPEIIKGIWEALAKAGFEGGNVLESSAGVGYFLGFCPKEIQEKTKFFAVEKDVLSGKILKYLYPDADVQITGFEEANLPIGKFDVAIGNPPFGQQKVFDKALDAQLGTFYIHNYFIGKNLIALREGGIGVFVVTSRLLDAKDKTFKKWITSQEEGNSDLVGAIRLPSNAFKKTAGTEVTTDTLVFKKRIQGEVYAFAETFTELEVIGKAPRKPTDRDQDGIEYPTEIELVVNEYFKRNPDFLLGRVKVAHEAKIGGLYDANEMVCEADENQDTPLLFNQRLPQIIDNSILEANATEIVDYNLEPIKEEIGEYVVRNNEVYVVTYNGAYKSYSALENSTKDKVEITKEYLNLKVKLLVLINLEANLPEGDFEAERKVLKQAYDSFTKKFGVITGNKKLVFLQEELHYFLIASLEVVKNKQIFEADILNKRVTFPFVAPSKAANLEDAFAISVSFYNKVDTGYIAKLLDKELSEVENDLLTQSFPYLVNGEEIFRPLAFKNPTNGQIEEAEKYLSGDILEKLETARKFAETEESYKINVSYLESTLPRKLTIDEIYISLGSTFIPVYIIEDFAASHLGVRVQIRRIETSDINNYEVYVVGKHHVNRNIDAGIFYNYNNANWYSTDERTSKYTLKDGSVIEVKQPEISNKMGHHILEAIMNNSPLRIQRYRVDRENGKVVYTRKGDKSFPEMELDEELTNILQSKKSQLNNAFRTYVVQNAEFREAIEEIYNKKYNSYVERVWSEPNFDTYPNANPQIKLRPHQKMGVRRTISEAVGNFWGVGTGKTFGIITAAMEMRRLGIAKKPLVVVQNATLAQFVKDIKKLYPTAKVISPYIKERIGFKKKDDVVTDISDMKAATLSRKQRLSVFAQIATTDFDICVLPQSQFELIDNHPTRVKAYIRERVAELEAQLDVIENSDADKGQKKAISKKIQKQINDFMDVYHEQSIIEKLEKALEEQEAQKPKRVKDVGRAITNTHAKLMRQADKKADKFLYFEQLGIDALLIDEFHAYKRLGFPTSMQNVKGIDTAGSKRAFSTMLKIRFIYEKVKGERNVSAWTGTPISNTMAELWTMGKYLKPSVLKKFDSLPFDSFASNFGDVVESFEMDAGGNFKTVSRFAKFNNMPELLQMWKSYAYVVIGDEVFKQPTKEEMADFFKNFDPNENRPVMKEQTVEVDGEVQKIRGFTSIVVPKSKHQRKQTNIFGAILSYYDGLKGEEKKELSHVPLVLFNYARRATIDLRLLKDYIVGVEEYPMHNEVEDKENKVYACIREILRIYKQEAEKGKKSCQLVFCDQFKKEEDRFDYDTGENKKTEVYNAFKVIQNELIKAGIPEKEIVMIDTVAKSNRESLFEKAREGQVAVILGSTEKMGVGVNVQKNLIALHHIDAPNRPMDFEQRNGRIIRVGNTNPEVEVLTYGIESTPDAVAYSRLAIKQSFINQVMSGKVTGRSTEDELDDSEGFFSLLSAVLTGSSTAIDLQKVKKSIKEKEFEIDYLQKKIAQNAKREADLVKIQETRYSKEVISDYEIILKELKNAYPDFENVAKPTIEAIIEGKTISFDLTKDKIVNSKGEEREMKVNDVFYAVTKEIVGEMTMQDFIQKYNIWQNNINSDNYEFELIVNKMPFRCVVHVENIEGSLKPVIILYYIRGSINVIQDLQSEVSFFTIRSGDSFRKVLVERIPYMKNKVIGYFEAKERNEQELKTLRANPIGDETIAKVQQEIAELYRESSQLQIKLRDEIELQKLKDMEMEEEVQGLMGLGRISKDYLFGLCQLCIPMEREEETEPYSYEY
jgi:N12 class adenine-specific DNA methylase